MKLAETQEEIHKEAMRIRAEAERRVVLLGTLVESKPRNTIWDFLYRLYKGKK